jgi:hypothetical protein
LVTKEEKEMKKQITISMDMVLDIPDGLESPELDDALQALLEHALYKYRAPASSPLAGQALTPFPDSVMLEPSYLPYVAPQEPKKVSELEELSKTLGMVRACGADYEGQYDDEYARYEELTGEEFSGWGGM